MRSSAKFLVSLLVASKGSHVLHRQYLLVLGYLPAPNLPTSGLCQDGTVDRPGRGIRPERERHRVDWQQICKLEVYPEIAGLHPGSPVPARASPLHPVASRERIPASPPRIGSGQASYDTSAEAQWAKNGRRVKGGDGAPRVVEILSQAGPKSPIVRDSDGTAVEESRSKLTFPAVGLLLGNHSSHHGVARDQNWGSHAQRPLFGTEREL